MQAYRADRGQPFPSACRERLPNARPVVDRFHVAKKFHEAIDGQRKKITRAYQAQLSKTQRKEFRSLMWEFRRNPQERSAEEKAQLETLVTKRPRLRTLYALRVRCQRILDTAPDRPKALGRDIREDFPELDPFLRTFETWQEEILNYFDARQTSGPVEEVNNKARVLVKRAYGLKSADRLWCFLRSRRGRGGNCGTCRRRAAETRRPDRTVCEGDSGEVRPSSDGPCGTPFRNSEVFRIIPGFQCRTSDHRKVCNSHSVKDLLKWALQDLNLSSGPLIGVGPMALRCCNPLPALSFRTVRR